METLLFFHGGPGLNSNPEQHMLTEIYKNKGIEFKGWNEPSTLRGSFDNDFANTRFKQLLDSAEKFLLKNYNGKAVYLMGHSMGCQTIIELLRKHNDKIKAIFMSSPSFHIYEADKNIFTFIQEDYDNHNDKINSEKLKKIILNISGKFDNNTIKGWETVLENPRALDYYWCNRDTQLKYYKHFISPEFSLDIEGFLEVRKSFTDVELFISDKKVIVFYSEKDSIVLAKKESATIKKYFSNLTTYNMEKSVHYPHIEEAEKVLDIIINEIKCI